MQPTIGRIVHYKLTEEEAKSINKRYEYSIAFRKQNPNHNDGDQHHVGNSARAGDIIPAIIVKVWPNEFGDKPGVNGQAFLDGNDSFWITSKGEGTENGQWSWPPRV